MSEEQEDALHLIIDDDDEDATPPPSGAPWRILVIDDDPAIHAVTRAVLYGSHFLDRPIVTTEATSSQAARKILAESPDIAVAILDVVMESNDSGLKLVGLIREEMKLEALRIIVRTGQPGYAPEREVIERYDINDYRLKSELTASALYTSVIAALRSYYEISSRIEAEHALRRAKEMAERAEINSKIEESRFRDFAETAVDLFWETDKEHYVTFFSRQAEFLPQDNKAPSAPFPLSGLGAIVSPEAQPQWNSIVAAVTARSAFRDIELSLQTLEGECRFFSFTGRPCFSPGQDYQGHRGTATDVTERRHAAMARQARERAEAAEGIAKAEQRRFQDFAASSADWYWESDGQGLMRYHSQPNSTVIQPEQFLDCLKTFIEHITCDDHPINQLFWERFQTFSAAQRPFRDLEFELTLPSGARRAMTVSGVPAYDREGRYLGYRGTTRDITVRRQNEIALQQSKERVEALSKRLTQIMESSPTITYVLEPAYDQRRSIFITDNIEGLVGFKASAFLDFPDFWISNIHPDDLFAVFRDYRILFDTGRLDSEYRFRHQDGRWLWLRDSQTLVRDGTGEPAEIVGSLSDVTDRKRAEEALGITNAHLQRTLEDLRQTQAQLVHAEKMTALGQLVSGVAHEINNPLGYVIANLESLQEVVAETALAAEEFQAALAKHGPPGLKSTLEAILHTRGIAAAFDDVQHLLPVSLAGLARIARIIHNLRLFSRLDSMEARHENLADLIEGDLDLVKRQLADQHIEIIRDFENLPQVECYAGELNQVFMNLIVNASHAMPQGGTLSIRGRMENEATVRLEFEDTGTGIPQEIMAKIFEPFFTTKPVGKGTGLGLSITYGIVTNRHRGKIQVKSEIGSGSVFTILLPIQLTKS